MHIGVLKAALEVLSSVLTPTSVVSLWLVQALARALLDQFSLLKISHRKMLVIPFLYLHIWRVSMPFFFLPFFVLALCLYDLAQWNSMVLLTGRVDLYCTFFSSSIFIGPYHHFHRYTSIQIFAAQNKLGGESHSEMSVTMSQLRKHFCGEKLLRDTSWHPYFIPWNFNTKQSSVMKIELP